MLQIELNMYQAVAVAALVLLLGRFLVSKIPFLTKYCIPDPIVRRFISARGTDAFWPVPRPLWNVPENPLQKASTGRWNLLNSCGKPRKPAITANCSAKPSAVV